MDRHLEEEMKAINAGRRRTTTHSLCLLPLLSSGTLWMDGRARVSEWRL